MKKTLEYILSAIAEKGEKVNVEEQEQNGIINFTIKVDRDDMGKVIGKNGRVIRALRSVMKIPAIKQNKKIYINLAED